MGKDKNSNYNEDIQFVKYRMLPQCGGCIYLSL